MNAVTRLGDTDRQPLDASNSSVWLEWQNLTGWDSDGLVFLMGVLNGAFTIGTPDAATHMSEEVPNPRVNVPWGICAQLTSGFLTSFPFYIVLVGLHRR